MFKENIKDTDDIDECTFFGFPCDPQRTSDRFRPRTDSGEFQTNYRFDDWSTTTFGVEYKRRSADTSDGIDEAIRNMGYYLQEQLQFLDKRLIMIPGIRLDDNQSFGTEWTPSFSAAYLFREIGTKLKAGYAKGFKAPTLNELFFPPAFGCPAFGNPNLDPEKSWELNAGVEQDVLDDRIKMGATYFHREVKDLIEGRPIPGDPSGCFRAVNVGSARFDGRGDDVANPDLCASFLGHPIYVSKLEHRRWHAAAPAETSRQRGLELSARWFEREYCGKHRRAPRRFSRCVSLRQHDIAGLCARRPRLFLCAPLAHGLGQGNQRVWQN